MRWPGSAQSAADALLERDASARRLLAEFKALDQVLAAAPKLPQRSLTALADRIAQDARRSPRIAGIGPSTAEVATGMRKVRPAQTLTRAAALLAASLVTGIFIGETQPVQATFAILGDATGIVWDQQTALAQAIDDVSDED